MATTEDYVRYVCEQISGVGEIRYRKMFGEYLVYVSDKPILLVCDNTVYVKKLDCIADTMRGSAVGTPYTGAKEHYVLDIDNAAFSREIVTLIEPVTALPKPKKKK